MMKARQYDRRFLVRKNEDGFPDVPQPRVYEICESNGINRGSLKYFGWSMDDIERNMAHSQLIDLLDAMQDAKEYGSILNIKQYNWDLLYRYVGTVDYSGQLDFDAGNLEETKDKLWELVEIAATMAQKYDIVVTNPPYMPVSNGTAKLNTYVTKNYPDSKADMFAVFMERCKAMLKINGYQAMITMHSWMFLGSFEKLRAQLQNVDIVNMAHLGARAFDEINGEVVQTTSFIFRKSFIPNYASVYCRLINANSQEGKERLFLSGDNRYIAKQKHFQKIPGAPIAYWVSESVFRAFREYPSVSTIGEAKAGMTTGDNERFLRLWQEINYKTIGFGMTSNSDALLSRQKWFPYNKGGGYRKWYGLNEYVVLWENDGYQIKNAMRQGRKIASVRSERLYFKKSITWATLSSSAISARFSECGHLFDDKGSSAFIPEGKYDFVLALINSRVGDYFLNILNPTMSFQSGNIGALPICQEEKWNNTISTLSKQAVRLSKDDWDSFETSWDFPEHPMVRLSRDLWDATAIGASMQYYYGCHLKVSGPLELCYMLWQGECQERFKQLKQNEEELNRIFIDIYSLQDELPPEVEDKDVTVRLADKKRDIKSLISYAVGCMFGRYSLDVPGLAYAGGEWDDGKYTTFKADKDSIIPICDDEYFADDIVGRFIRFIEVVYGKDTLQENLRFIADALGGSGQPKDVIRNYFLNDFYADHLKVYQKRPVYWLFDSGKKNGFKALVYMHRYQPDTIARMRTDYVHEQQARYRTAIADLEQRIASASTAERVKLSKRLKQLQEQATEIQGYEEKIHHLADQYIAIDLDDGVKKNYAIFGDVLAKIK